jgi:uncharacterized protein YpbB
VYAASDFANTVAPKTSQNLRYHRFRERIEVEEVWETVRLKCSTFDQHVEEILAPYVWQAGRYISEGHTIKRESDVGLIAAVTLQMRNIIKTRTDILEISSNMFEEIPVL